MKARFKVSQLAAKPVEIELVHPTQGPTGICVKVVGPHSTALKTAYQEFEKIDNPSEEDNLKLFIAGVVGWDEEAFELPFNKENVYSFFMQPENAWISEQLAPKLMDRNIFFRQKSEEVAPDSGEPSIAE